MHQMTDIFVDGGDRIQCRFHGPNHVLEVRPRDRRADGLTLFGSTEAMRRLRDALTASLEAAGGDDGEPDGSKDPRDIVPASAAVDVDDVIASALGMGRANCPGEVP